MEIKPLTLVELKSREASNEELQATLIAFIEHVNGEFARHAREINGKEPKVWRATI